MEGFSESIRSAAEALDRMEAERERALSLSRSVIRLSKRAIHDIHTGASPGGRMAELEEAKDGIMECCQSPVVQDALMEYAEAAILASLVSDDRVPSAEELGIPVVPWILGLADCVGELRRRVTSEIIDGDLEAARRHMEAMEEICGELMLLDVPDAVAPVRRKQDVARGVVDRTRSDLIAAASAVGRF